MSSQIFVFILLIVSIANSLKCPYLQWNTGGAAMPCNLCLNAQECEDDGNCTSSSYMFDCLYDTNGAATLDTYWDSDCNDGNLWMSWDLTGYVTISDNDGAGSVFAVCDHITFRSYPARRGQTGQNCIKDENSGYYEYAVMNGCYDTLITPRRSAYVVVMYIPSSHNIYKYYIHRDISCESDGLDVTYYSQQQCAGHVINSNHTSIHDGCGNELININNTIFKRLFPNFGNSNQTYFEISECGGGWPPQWLVDLFIALSVVSCLCFVCCAVGCCWWCSFRRKKKKQVQNALINQPVVGYQTADGITTTA